jgi:Zn-dependent peptidase ImmA (M78 family)
MSADPETMRTIRQGDVDSFACSVRFYPEPDAEPDTDPDLAVSWGELAIWVHGRNLCANWMHAEPHDGVHWYLLPFLEWIAANWDPLLHEERTPHPDSGSGAAEDVLRSPVPVGATAEQAVDWFSLHQEWIQRHALHAAADGGLFPRVFLRRYRGEIEVSWDNSDVTYGPDDFGFNGKTGYDFVGAKDVAKTLYAVAQDATEHLRKAAARSERIDALASAVDALADERRSETRVSWLAGLGSTADEIRERWRTALGIARIATKRSKPQAVRAALGAQTSPLLVSGSCRAAVLFGSMSPAIRDADVQLIARLLVSAYAPEHKRSELDDISRHAPPIYDDAWEEGYELAEQVHAELAFDTTRPIDIVGTIRRLKVRRIAIELTDSDVRGISLTSPVHRSTIAVNERFVNHRRETVLRFTLAHELCHILFDQDFEHELAMASGPWAPRAIEKRANAFAAMFLMPRPLVREAIAHATEAPETLGGVRQLAHFMQTSISTTIEHLFNLNQLDGYSRDRLREELGFGFG